jgi:hypothetical protein
LHLKEEMVVDHALASNAPDIQTIDLWKAADRKAGGDRRSYAPGSLFLEIQPATGLRAGDLCPRCGQARLEYDGLLHLACPECKYALEGCNT